MNEITRTLAALIHTAEVIDREYGNPDAAPLWTAQDAAQLRLAGELVNRLMGRLNAAAANVASAEAA